jgi:hypothetical protein
MKNIFLLVLISFLISNISYSEETTLHCKFVEGDMVEIIADGQNRYEYGVGDIEDEYLVIDFEKKKIKSAPYYRNIFVSNPFFEADQISWYGGKKNVFSYSAKLDRKNGRLWIIHNEFPKEIGALAWEYNYDCEDAKLKF